VAVPGVSLTPSVDGIATPKQALLVWQRLSQFLPRQRLLRESLMQQRQLRLGDILDDYCPRERRVTNHAVVAMVGADVKQTRCTTCEAEHEYKHAKVPRQRKKSDTPAALYAHGAAGGPKRVLHDPAPEGDGEGSVESPPGGNEPVDAPIEPGPDPELHANDGGPTPPTEPAESEPEIDVEEGPVHRPLIRATLPRPEGQPPPTRPAPEFTIRQPAGRPGRFRPRHPHGSPPFQGSRSGNNNMVGGGGMSRPGSGRPPASRSGRRHGSGRKRSK
jgi:hypothetical protein